MNETNEYWRDLKEHRKRIGKKNRDRAARNFRRANRLAKTQDLKLIKHTDAHYQIRRTPDFLIDVYPGNQRIVAHGKAPLFEIKRPWTLIDVVEAVIKVIQPERNHDVRDDDYRTTDHRSS